MALSKVETGETKSITIDLGKKIAEALEISFNELFDIEVPENARNEEVLKANIENLQKLNAEQKQLLELRNEMLHHYETLYTMIYQQSFTIIDDAISLTISELSGIYKDANIEFPIPEFKKLVMEQMRSKYIDFFTVMFQKMAGSKNLD